MIHLQLGSDVDEFTETVVYDPQQVIDQFTSVEVLESRMISNTFDEMDWELILRVV